MIFYGSKARGDFDPWSDLGVAIIIQALTREGKKLLFETIAELELDYLTPLSILVLPGEKFERLHHRESGIAVDIENGGYSVMTEENKLENITAESGN